MRTLPLLLLATLGLSSTGCKGGLFALRAGAEVAVAVASVAAVEAAEAEERRARARAEAAEARYAEARERAAEAEARRAQPSVVVISSDPSCASAPPGTWVEIER